MSAHMVSRRLCAALVVFGSLCIGTNHGQVAVSQIQPGVFEPNWESLKHYQTARWFRDAKFGIFIHWGVYSVPAFGSEWYPRAMYTKGSAEYAHHLATYGPQTEFGYKDFIPLFRAEKWDPNHWAEIFKRSGARYVVPVAEHHDGFPMYDCSRSRWNAAKMGPKRDIIGELAKAVRERGLVFGLSSHRAEHWWFMNGGRTIDSDVKDLAYADFYGPAQPDTVPPSKEYLEDWYARCKELVDKYHPQLFYFDWWIEQPVFAPYLQKFAAYYYNSAGGWNKEVVLNYKNTALPDRTAVLDIERGRLNDIRQVAWQTDTSIGKKSWGYIQNEENRSADELVDILVDIVSKNGCLLLNIGPKPDGTIPDQQEKVLLDIGSWLDVNGEAIYGTRPWECYGEGVRNDAEGMFSEARSRPYTSKDIRFTAKGASVFAVCLDWPGESLWIKNLRPAPGSTVALLGYRQPLHWEWVDGKGLLIRLPNELQKESARPCKYAYAFRVEGSHAPVAETPVISTPGGKPRAVTHFTDSLNVELSSGTPGASLYYTLDGSDPTELSARYSKPVLLAESARLRAIAIKAGFVRSEISEEVFTKIENVARIQCAFPYDPKYSGSGDLTLFDSQRGTPDYNDLGWLGFEKQDLEVAVELKKKGPVRRICVGCLEDQKSWIFFPTGLEVLGSANGQDYSSLGKMDIGGAKPNGQPTMKDFCLDVNGDDLKFLRIRANNVGICPPWHNGAGGKAWLFVDEIKIDQH